MAKKQKENKFRTYSDESMQAVKRYNQKQIEDYKVQTPAFGFLTGFLTVMSVLLISFVPYASVVFGFISCASLIKTIEAGIKLKSFTDEVEEIKEEEKFRYAMEERAKIAYQEELEIYRKHCKSPVVKDNTVEISKNEETKEL